MDIIELPVEQKAMPILQRAASDNGNHQPAQVDRVECKSPKISNLSAVYKANKFSFECSCGKHFGNAQNLSDHSANCAQMAA
jgi:hypothetical protein